MHPNSVIAADGDLADESRQLASIVQGIEQARAGLAAAQAAETVLLAAAQLIAERRIAREGSSSGSAAEMPLRSIAAEIGTMLRLSDRTVQQRMATAAEAVRAFPTSVRALGDGRIDRAHLDVIVAAGAHIADESARAAYESSVLEYAEAHSATRLRPVAALRAQAHDPRPLDERHRDASAERGVWMRALPDGMANLVAILPAPLAQGMLDRLRRLAIAVKDARRPDPDTSASRAATHAHEGEDGDPAVTDARGIDALRADILADLVLAAEPTAHATTGVGAIRAHVQVVVPVERVAERAAAHDAGAAPAVIPGTGPIDDRSARLIAGGAEGWDRIVVDSDGAVLAVDRYRPSARLRRALGARDVHCRFRGCRVPLRGCDIDHTVDAQFDGPTSYDNLAHLCRRHHSLKHASAWTVRQRPGGVLEWTSPSGRSYEDTPASAELFARPDAPGGPPRVAFALDDPAPAPF